MIYFIITTCLSPSLFKDAHIRQSQYIIAINKLKEIILKLEIKNYKIILVENTNNKYTFLDTLDCRTFYTSNNFLDNKNKGYKELQDILDCIDNLEIDDNDFIVKMTGRYILEDNSEFMNIIKDIDDTKYDCVIRYGSYLNPVNYKMNDCITGLIGMRCRYIKMIEKPNEEPVEWKWGKVTNLIEDKNIYIVNKLGINICPGSNRYFKV